MATPTTVNGWLDQLSASVIEKCQQKKVPNVRKLQDTFRRRVRRHNYGRTNQFEVANRLDGLEEKFQVLSLDNLSDALRRRRIELKPFENHWLPDVLDLFLHLSGNPTTNKILLDLYRIPPRIGTPPPLKWNDLLADSPIDRSDRLWKVPDFRDTDDSGYDDDFASSIGSVILSPQKNREQSHAQNHLQVSKLLYEKAADSQSTSNVSIVDAESRELSELQFIRDCLFLVRGYHPSCFSLVKTKMTLSPGVQVRGLTPIALNHVAKEFLSVRARLDRVVLWMSEPVSEPYIAALQCAVQDVVQAYYRALDSLQQDLLQPDVPIVASLSSISIKISLVSTEISIISRLIREIGQGDSITHLEVLYAAVQDSQLCADVDRYACLASLLKPTLNLYLKTVIVWLETGSSAQDALPPFIESAATNIDLRKIWTGRFNIASSTHQRAPKFLAGIVPQILACGKTSAFLDHLRVKSASSSSELPIVSNFELPSTEYMFLPFAQAFEQALQQYVEDRLLRKTLELKRKLSIHCSFGRILNSIEQLHFPRNGLLMHDIEVQIFERIDRCINSWNDQFQLKDMLEDAFHDSKEPGLIDSINIRSAYTSSRNMQSQRTSVRILSSLSFEFVLSWPLANIISDTSMISYRRIALMLMQIRRAKYCLERTGYTSAVSVPLSPNASLADQTFAQTLAFTLLTFVNTLFDGIMLGSVWPATDAMQAQLQDAPTIDAMIRIHREYITQLECSCLATSRLKLLRQSLISILDLCIRFSDLVSNPSKIDRGESDHEASSFISAKSRNKSLRVEQYGSDEEDEDYSRRLGDGYSSFIVLDNDTTIVNELRKVKLQFEKQVEFLISGLRGVSKGGHDMANLDTLAERLCWLNAR